ncbi:MAG: biotin/lipoyl-containing protein, partial [Verrucomicrobiia bacterium]
MSIELKVPPVGESINEVEIGEWLKKEGAAVGKDEPVAMLESEKASIELLAPEDGVLGKVLKATGEIAAVGDVVALLETGGAAGAGKPAEAAPVAARVEKAAESGDGAIVVMPAAERALADAGLKAGDVQATGPGGRLLKEDVLRHTDSSKDDK